MHLLFLIFPNCLLASLMSTVGRVQGDQGDLGVSDLTDWVEQWLAGWLAGPREGCGMSPVLSCSHLTSPHLTAFPPVWGWRVLQ